MYPHNTSRSQAPNIVHFGLGAAGAVERLQVRWPSGRVQEFSNLAGDRHIIIDEEREEPQGVETVVAGRTFRR
jgi:hypothetical protein